MMKYSVSIWHILKSVAYFSDVLWEQIIKFYDEQNKQCELLKEDFYRNGALLCGIMSKQNDLNISLQGKTNSIYDR